MKKNEPEAVQQYQLAAAQGYAPAEINLKKMLGNITRIYG